MFNQHQFEEIYIEKSVRDHFHVRQILEKLGNPPFQSVADLYSLIKTQPPVYHPLQRARKLYLGSIKGEIIKKCPGSQGHLCCNYHVINLYIGCPLNCSYCILQSYLNQPFVIINVDIETIFENLATVARNNPQKIYRIGTGELGDSLVYDDLTGFSRYFIDFFRQYPHFIFEFKTKTDRIDNLLQIKAAENIVVGFSVNPQAMISREENRAASLEERLKAAAELARKNYKIAFHFDPVIYGPDFESQYYSLIEEIFRQIKPRQIAWISLGTFRYPPDLKNKIEFNYPDNAILYEEFVACADKKFRYFKPLRLAIYRRIINWLRQKHQKLLIYLCMESPAVWMNSLGYLPGTEKKMDFIFKKAVMEK